MTPSPHEAQEPGRLIADRWTIGRLLTWTADFLKKKGADSPRLDAEVLLAHALVCERVKLYTRFEEEVADAPRAAYRELVRRRAEGTPVAYLVGKKEFFSIGFHVSPAVLIPRADSEHLVVAFLAAFKGIDAPRFVDVGTGSGCLALACLKGHPTATALAVDISPDALAVAARNAETLGLADRITFRLGDGLGPVAADGPFDAILSNPPYIRTGVVPDLDREVAHHEPRLALDGGPDGLRVVGPLIAGAVATLKPGGSLLLEIGSDQEAEVRALIAAQPGLILRPTIRDHSHHPRVLVADRVV